MILGSIVGDKASAIIAVREVRSVGVKDDIDLVAGVPTTLKTDVSREEAKASWRNSGGSRTRWQCQDAGATIRLCENTGEFPGKG